MPKNEGYGASYAATVDRVEVEAEHDAGETTEDETEHQVKEKVETQLEAKLGWDKLGDDVRERVVAKIEAVREMLKREGADPEGYGSAEKAALANHMSDPDYADRQLIQWGRRSGDLLPEGREDHTLTYHVGKLESHPSYRATNDFTAGSWPLPEAVNGHHSARVEGYLDKDNLEVKLDILQDLDKRVAQGWLDNGKLNQGEAAALFQGIQWVREAHEAVRDQRTEYIDRLNDWRRKSKVEGFSLPRPEYQLNQESAADLFASIEYLKFLTGGNADQNLEGERARQLESIAGDQAYADWKPEQGEELTEQQKEDLALFKQLWEGRFGREENLGALDPNLNENSRFRVWENIALLIPEAVEDRAKFEGSRGNLEHQNINHPERDKPITQIYQLFERMSGFNQRDTEAGTARYKGVIRSLSETSMMYRLQAGVAEMVDPGLDDNEVRTTEQDLVILEDLKEQITNCHDWYQINPMQKAMLVAVIDRTIESLHATTDESLSETEAAEAQDNLAGDKATLAWILLNRDRYEQGPAWRREDARQTLAQERERRTG